MTMTPPGRWPRLRTLALAVLSLALVPPTDLPAHAHDGRLVLGIFAYRHQPLVEAQYAPLAAYLGARLSEGHGATPVELRVLDADAMTEALVHNELDLILTNPSFYQVLRSQNALTGVLATVVNRQDGAPTAALGGVIFARAERADLNALQDLRGQRIAIPGTHFLGGFQTQAFELRAVGIRLPGDAELLEVGSHDAVVAAVLDGRAAVGFVRSGILESLAREGLLDLAAVRIVNRQDLRGFPYIVSTRLYPEWPFLALPHLDDRLIRRITSALLALDSEHPAARAAGIDGFAPPADYLPVEELARTLRLPPFDALPLFTWHDVWERYRLPIVAASLLTLLLLALTWRLARSRQALADSEGHLRLERDRLDSIVSATQIGIWEWDLPSGRFIDSEHCAAMLGYRLDELAPATLETWDRLIHPDDRDVIETRLQRYYRGECGHLSVEARMRHRDGHWIWVLLHARVSERSPAGQPLTIRGIQIDVTERRQMVENLRESQARLDQIAEHSRTVVWEVDPNGRYTYISPVARSVFGYRPDELIGMHTCFDLHPAEGRDQFKAQVLEAFARQLPFEHFINRVETRDGHEIWVSTNGLPVMDASGHLWGYRGSDTDITARYLAEQALHASKAELERANAALQAAIEQARALAAEAQSANLAKSAFLANMSHEIRTPMNGVIGMTDLLLDTPLTPEQRYYGDAIHTSGQALLALINDILDFSKIEAGKLRLEELDFDLLDLLDDLLATLAPRAHAQGLDLLCASEPGVPAAVRGDPGRLRQILTNLIGNAIKFTPTGEVIVRVKTTRRQDRLVWLEFRISDTGIGIAPHQQRLLFEKFSQVDESPTRRYGGTGLGLAIVRQLVELMGGQVGVLSAEGAGSTFYFEVPLMANASLEPPPLAVAALAGVRLLIVDDNASARAILREQVQAWGLRAEVQADGPGALGALYAALAEGDPIRVALVDQDMPNMDGATFSRLVLADPRLATLGLILMRASVSGSVSPDPSRFRGTIELIKPPRMRTLHALLLQLHKPDPPPGPPPDAPRPQDRPAATLH